MLATLSFLALLPLATDGAFACAAPEDGRGWRAVARPADVTALFAALDDADPRPAADAPQSWYTGRDDATYVCWKVGPRRCAVSRLLWLPKERTIDFAGPPLCCSESPAGEGGSSTEVADCH